MADSRPEPGCGLAGVKVMHLTTVDSSLRYLLLPQLLAARAHGAEVVAISAPGPEVAFLERSGIRHVALPSSTRGMDLRADLRAARELWKTLRRERPDVLHTHNPKPGLYGRVVGRLAGVPVVVNTCHGLYATERDRARRRFAVYLLEGVASRFSDVEFVQNPEDLDLLRRLRLAPHRRLRHLGNGVDLGRFATTRYSGADRRRARAELGLTDDVVAVGTVARLVAEKGVPELCAAAAHLGPEFVVLVAGPTDPDKPDAIDEMTLTRARAAGVRFLGHVTDVERLYLALDVFALPSHREGFPRAAMEAAAMGLPIVAADVRGCRQVVADGDNGVLVPVGDAAALATAIGRLADPQLRRAMGRASRRRAETEFDERRVVTTVLDAYARALAVHRGRSIRTARRRTVAALVKRGVDVSAAAVGLVVLAPLLAAVALSIRLTMGRPILFRQARPGLRGEPFTILKFRTMRDVTDADGRPLSDAERLTRLGRWLRISSLDELPELVNVLRGEMSLVGPRPLLVSYLDRYTPLQARRHEVRPGLTGWAQVNGRNAQQWHTRLAHDVWYVDNWSLRLDARILARTVALIVRRQGISHDGHATMPELGPQPGDGP